MDDESTQPDAAASLAQIADAQLALVEATGRPVGLDAALALVMGAIIALLSVRTAPANFTAIAVGVVGLISIGVVEGRLVRRQGRILDLRSLNAQTWSILAVVGLAPVFSLFDPGDSWQPWYSIGVGVLIAGSAFGGLRRMELYQRRRLAKGDYHRYDLI